MATKQLELNIVESDYLDGFDDVHNSYGRNSEFGGYRLVVQGGHEGRGLKGRSHESRWLLKDDGFIHKWISLDSWNKTCKIKYSSIRKNIAVCLFVLILHHDYSTSSGISI